MKSATVRKVMNLILVAVMLLSGMCFEYVEADSLFAHSVNENHSYTTVLTSAKEMPTSQTICTNEIAGSTRIECGEVQARKDSHKSVIRTGTALSFLEALPKTPILTKSVMMESVDNQPSGKEVIIAYIHHQDGEKGSF